MKKNLKISSLSIPFLGTILEWYDFSLFAYFAPIISELFFPSSNKFASYLIGYSVFAISFLIRPIGALVLGYYGDRRGRKSVLLFSMYSISISTLLIGMLPTFEKIGIIAPVLLIILRLIQGFCVAGETTGSVSFVIESNPHQYRGLIGSFAWSAVGIGILASSLAITIITKLFSEKLIYQFAWRLPFFLGIFTAITAHYFNKKIPETSFFLERKRNMTCKEMTKTIKKHKKTLLKIACLYALSSIITYITFVFMPVYVSKVTAIPISKTSFITTIMLALVTVFVPIVGLLSDYLGRKPCLLIGAAGFALLSYPLYALVCNIKSISIFIFAEFCFAMLAIFYQGSLTSTVQEMTETSMRYTITAFGYNFSYALFGGSAPLIVTYALNLSGSNMVPGVYLTIAAIISIFSICCIKETSKINLE